ncbi:MAG: HAD-IA family hydrolase [Pseudomonadota bacterium]
MRFPKKPLKALNVYDLIIFDCDGVLINSEMIAARVQAAAYKREGFEMEPLGYAEHFAGFTHHAIREAIEEELERKLDEDFTIKLEEAFLELADSEMTAVDGTEAMLDQIELPRCICSNSDSRYLRTYLSDVGLYERFEPHIFSASEVGTKAPKPDPNVFQFAAQQFAIEPSKCLVVEDSATGVSAAVAAGMTVIGFVGADHSWPGHAEALSEAGAITTINRHADLAETVAALSSWQAP